MPTISYTSSCCLVCAREAYHRPAYSTPCVDPKCEGYRLVVESKKALPHQYLRGANWQWPVRHDKARPCSCTPRVGLPYATPARTNWAKVNLPALRSCLLNHEPSCCGSSIAQATRNGNTTLTPPIRPLAPLWRAKPRSFLGESLRTETRRYLSPRGSGASGAMSEALG